MSRSLGILVCVGVLCGFVQADNWPAWRGPKGDGASSERNLPLTWSATANVRWKTPLPEPGNSTPIIWGSRVFITQALDGGKQRAILAFDRKNGKEFWRHKVPCNVQETTHKQNPSCSSSPVTDGKTVYAQFGSAGVVACDFDGKQLWHRDLGPVVSRWGNGSSPILYRDLLIVFHGPGEPNTFLIALDKHTGKTVWQTNETAINSPVFGSWSTPVLVKAGTRDELVMPLPGDKVGGEGLFKGYDPNTGKELWSCNGLGNEIYAMPAVNETGDLIVGISGHNGPLVAVKPGGKGDVTATHRAWRVAGKNPQRVGSAAFAGGRLYLADAPGTLECIDPKTGEPLWKERLDGNLWGSVLVADGRLYVSNLEGETFVLAAGPTFKLLARNKIGEAIYAAPAVSNGEVFLRT
ncbi:MAG: PQQ-binding-like beta-propeller repeat protein, partial [Planctomycetes bacterium]|nr:PQQ-binding-like beta-propeller repeat protein [Planctomycetota bacterium]